MVRKFPLPALLLVATFAWSAPPPAYQWTDGEVRRYEVVENFGMSLKRTHRGVEAGGRMALQYSFAVVADWQAGASGEEGTDLVITVREIRLYCPMFVYDSRVPALGQVDEHNRTVAEIFDPVIGTTWTLRLRADGEVEDWTSTAAAAEAFAGQASMELAGLFGNIFKVDGLARRLQLPALRLPGDEDWDTGNWSVRHELMVPVDGTLSWTDTADPAKLRANYTGLAARQQPGLTLKNVAGNLVFDAEKGALRSFSWLHDYDANIPDRMQGYQEQRISVRLQEKAKAAADAKDPAAGPDEEP